MGRKSPFNVPTSEITPEYIYHERRRFMQIMGAGILGIPTSSMAGAEDDRLSGLDRVNAHSVFSSAEVPTPFKDASHYNNYYEFGLDKEDPSRNAGGLKTRPWSVAIEGAVNKPGTYQLEDLLRPHALEERIYRLRCVEAWSMVIPWVGFPLADLLKRFEPGSKAKFVYFETLHDPQQMPEQRSLFSTIEWPYREGLRMDEAMHPLTLIAVGMYGKELPNQNGAPLRLVVPWKYGFKSIKSIVKIRLQEEQPKTTWELTAPREYGFYANVNPGVDHPRWSQAQERRLPSSSLFKPNLIKTQLFNGYAEQVAHLYRGMDLRRFF
jgi:sulfoxide reductase catalytic subunit YedY